LHRYLGGFDRPEHRLYVQPIGTGIHCANPNCITCDPAERQYAANKFYLVEEPSPPGFRLRCLYCETDIDEGAAAHFVVADPARKTYALGLGALTRVPVEKLRHFVIYTSEAEAAAAGFQPRENGKRARTG
jgi:Aspartate carbamoyltransferase regulatory chain, metal binding domain